MPKIKTNKMASKKFRVGGKGRIKRRHANSSHNTAKRSSKRMRRIKRSSTVNPANTRSAMGLLKNESFE